jgi:hypothetical protein
MRGNGRQRPQTPINAMQGLEAQKFAERCPAFWITANFNPADAYSRIRAASSQHNFCLANARIDLTGLRHSASSYEVPTVKSGVKNPDSADLWTGSHSG